MPTEYHQVIYTWTKSASIKKDLQSLQTLHHHSGQAALTQLQLPDHQRLRSGLSHPCTEGQRSEEDNRHTAEKGEVAVVGAGGK